MINHYQPRLGRGSPSIPSVASHILQIATRTKLQQAVSTERSQHRYKTMIEVALQRLSSSRAVQLLNGHTFTATEDIAREETHSRK